MKVLCVFKTRDGLTAQEIVMMDAPEPWDIFRRRLDGDIPAAPLIGCRCYKMMQWTPHTFTAIYEEEEIV